MAEHAKYISLTPKLYQYLIAHGHNGDPIRAELAAETAKLGMISGMQIAAEQGTFMGLLAGAIGARSCGRSRHLHRLQRTLCRSRAAR